MINRVNNNKDKILALPIIYFIIANVYFSFGRSLVNFIAMSNIVSLYLIYGTTSILILFSFRYLNRKSILYLFILEIFFILTYLFSYLMGYMDNEIILQYTVITLVICIPFTVLVVSMDDLKFLYNGLVKASYWNILLLLLYFVSEWDSITYSMPAAYQILFSAVVHVNELFTKKNRIKTFLLILVIIEVVLILVKGSRGPLLILFVYIALKFLVEFRKNKKVMIWFVLGSLGALVILLNMSEFLNAITKFLNNNNIYSRNLTLLLNNNIFDDSGRSELHNLAIELISKNPIIGYGASSDVKLLGGAYVHSFYLELFINYGLILGSVLFVLISFESIRVLFIRSGVNKDLLLIFLVLGYVMLMISSTYLQNIYLFLFLGLVFRKKRYSTRIIYTNTGGK